MSSITDPLLLPGDVHLVPVAELEPEVRQRIEFDDGDFAITRLRSRTPSKVIDADSADLVERFRQATTIAEAVVAYCAEHAGNDPSDVLSGAFPILQDLINAQLLVPADTPQADDIEYHLAPGQEVDGFTAVRAVQLLEDTELHQARTADGGWVAIKMARFAESALSRRQLAHERAVLERLDGAAAPRLVGEGEIDGRPYLALEWCEGISAAHAAAEHRREHGTAPLALAIRIARAYADLHRRGVLHGDVHPSNLLVDGAGTVRLIDFGLARLTAAEADTGEPSRGGVPFFFDPEFAAARQEEGEPPRVTAAAEQYSLAALLYNLLTGEHYVEFSLEQETMLRQIREDEPRSFAALGLEPDPALEAALARALAKTPGDRFANVAELADALAAAAAGRETETPAQERDRPASPTAGTALLDSVLEAVRLDGPLLADGLPASPTASVNNGGAGIAWLLYRLAQLRDDPELLALADVWALDALGRVDEEGAFYNPEIDMTPEVVGEISTFHTTSGLHAVRAMIALALGAHAFVPRHVAAFVEHADQPGDEMDLTLGWSSVLLTTAALVAALGDDEAAAELGLTDLGDRYLERLWQRLDELPAIAESVATVPSPGVAHGWGGFVYATLQWCRAAGRPVPAAVPARLDELARLAELVGRGARWPWRLDADEPVYMPGWCNGSAGYVFLWALAHEMLGDDRYLRLAERSAWNAWEDPAAVANLCCGFAGRGYALLHWHKRTGDDVWLERARRLAELAATAIREPQGAEFEGFEYSLYKGEVGVAALVADLERPDESALPFFEPEGFGT